MQRERGGRQRGQVKIGMQPCWADEIIEREYRGVQEDLSLTSAATLLWEGFELHIKLTSEIAM